MMTLLLTLLFACDRKVAPPAADDAPVSLRIVAMNDFHGALYEERDPKDPSVAYGGLPVLAGAVAALRAEHPDLILLDGGDCFQGSWPVNQSFGMGSVEAFNLLGVDAAAVGNHEFDYGGRPGGHPLRGALEAASEAAKFHWLSANVREADGARWEAAKIRPWAMIERQGKKIAVIGLTTTETPATTLKKNVADLTFVDPVATVRELLPEITAADADMVAIVGHLTGACTPKSYTELGEDCVPSGEIGRLLTELPPGTIDVMVVGHAHTLLAQRTGETFLLENRAKGHMLGVVDVVIGPDGVQPDASRVHAPWVLAHPPLDPGCEAGEYATAPLSVSGREVTPDPDALALVRRLEAESGTLCERIACAATPLVRERQAESAVGNVTADAMRAAFPQADLAITNSGGLRADIPAGEIRREHAQGVMPFDNRLRLVSLRGDALALLLRIGTSGGHGVMQVSGATVHFDPERAGGADLDADGAVASWETDRLCAVTVGGAPLDPQRTYTLVTTDFLQDGGDHLGPAFASATTVAEGPLLREALMDHLAAQTSCLGSEGPLVDPAAPRLLRAPCAETKP